MYKGPLQRIYERLAAYFLGDPFTREIEREISTNIAELSAGTITPKEYGARKLETMKKIDAFLRQNGKEN
jgi:hypothetical protein